MASQQPLYIRFSAQLSLGCADYNVINYGASYLCVCVSVLLENYFKNQTH